MITRGLETLETSCVPAVPVLPYGTYTTPPTPLVTGPANQNPEPSCEVALRALMFWLKSRLVVRSGVPPFTAEMRAIVRGFALLVVPPVVRS